MLCINDKPNSACILITVRTELIYMLFLLQALKMAESCPTKRLMQQTTMMGFLKTNKAEAVLKESVVESKSSVAEQSEVDSLIDTCVDCISAKHIYSINSSGNTTHEKQKHASCSVTRRVQSHGRRVL